MFNILFSLANILLLLKYLAMIVAVETLNNINISVNLKGKKHNLLVRVLYINDAYEAYEIEGKRTLFVLSDRPFIANHDALKHRKPKIFVFDCAGLVDEDIQVICDQIIDHLNRLKMKFRSLVGGW